MNQAQGCMVGHLTQKRAFTAKSCPTISRRQTLALGGSLLGGINLLRPSSAAAVATGAAHPAKAKSVIMLYLHGGAPTQDMFDMKPNAPVEVRGEFKPVATNVPGIEICELLPRMARWMHRAAVIRSVYHRSGCHNEIPSFTGYEPPPGNAQDPPDNLPPSMGSVCEYLKRPDDNRPAYVHLPGPLGYNGVGESGPGAGFLGRRYDPLMAAAAPAVDEGADVKNRAHPPQVRGLPRLADSQLTDGLTLERLARRQSLLTGIEARQPDVAAEVGGVDDFKQRAFDLLASPALRSCFDPALFDQRVRERYGNTLFGNSAFIASRLVASGVRFVNVLWTWYNAAIAGLQDFGWDTHEHNFATLGHFLPHLDLVYSSLMEDLDKSGLLDETLVVLTSDFGRTPVVNRTAGRDHWTHCYSTVLAGAGIAGGQVYGASDKHAAVPIDRPVRPADVCATIYRCLGIDPDMPVHDRFARPHKVAQGGEPVEALLA
ncbi:MAG TPA: DUF1501 domain-containing protein [Pirellulales bacterium]|jgi:hypothetical protein|nr:DUF1501 domain-containing protein [Pirellulales bacterium]